MTQDQKEKLNYLVQWMIYASAPVAAAAMIGIGGVLWGMYNQMQEMDATQRLWQERVGHQLDQISQRLDGTYSQRDGMRIESQIDEIDSQLSEHEDRIRALESAGGK